MIDLCDLCACDAELRPGRVGTADLRLCGVCRQSLASVRPIVEAARLGCLVLIAGEVQRLHENIVQSALDAQHDGVILTPLQERGVGVAKTRIHTLGRQFRSGALRKLCGCSICADRDVHDVEVIDVHALCDVPRARPLVDWLTSDLLSLPERHVIATIDGARWRVIDELKLRRIERFDETGYRGVRENGLADRARAEGPRRRAKAERLDWKDKRSKAFWRGHQIDPEGYFSFPYWVDRHGVCWKVLS